MCRMQIPSDYFDHPVLIEKSFHEETCIENGSSEKYQWYYEGRNGNKFKWFTYCIMINCLIILQTHFL